MNCKRHLTGNNKLKFYSNKIMLCGSGGATYKRLKVYFLLKSIDDRKITFKDK